MSSVTSDKPPDKGGTKQKMTGLKKIESPKDDKRTVTIEVPRWLFFGTSIFIAFISVLVGGYLGYTHLTVDRTNEEVFMNVGEEGYMLFTMHDRNQDGYLSAEEFEPLIYRLMETNVTGPVYDVPIDDDDELVTLRAFFEPLRLESMTKDLDEKFYGGIDQLSGLKNWKTPAIEWMNFGARHFMDFLPEKLEHISLGDAYYIFEVPTPLFMGSTLSSNRYYPPKVEKKAIILHRLLTLFHSRPFVSSRFAPQGSVACVRAYNDEYLDIVFRIHAEFQLNEPPYHPFWFTPAQFKGNLVIHRNSSKVLYFSMHVPNDRKLNVDMEWLTGTKENENMEVDIGYMPLMVLNNTAVSKNYPESESYMKDFDQPADPDLEAIIKDIEWTGEISQEDAARMLEIKMYPFKKIPYHNFTEVFDKASADKKLVHSILLWGALDDQSC